MLAALLLSVLVAAAGCAGSGAGASPAGSTAPSASAEPSAAGGPVTTEEQAIAAILAKEPRFKGIGKKDPDMIGQSSWYEIKPASGVGAFVVTIYVGWGDCQSGCIDHHTWTYSIAPDGSVTLLNESGSDPPPDAIPSGGGESGQGIQFISVAGPLCPVEQAADPACATHAVPDVTVIVSDVAGHSLGMTVLDGSGRRYLGLNPGDYVVRAQPAFGTVPAPEPQTVTVRLGEVTSVTLRFDEGAPAAA
jgi:hypothetical protein